MADTTQIKNRQHATTTTKKDPQTRPLLHMYILYIPTLYTYIHRVDRAQCSLLHQHDGRRYQTCIRQPHSHGSCEKIVTIQSAIFRNKETQP